MITKYSGDCMSVIYDIVNTANAKFGIHVSEPSIEAMVDMFADVPPAELPVCVSCESRVALIPCKDCHQFFCMDECKDNHVCGGGEFADRGRF